MCVSVGDEPVAFSSAPETSTRHALAKVKSPLDIWIQVPWCAACLGSDGATQGEVEAADSAIVG